MQKKTRRRIDARTDAGKDKDRARHIRMKRKA